jgi:anti-sigma regulatory factor (Ser/Thr protein kinase)
MATPSPATGTREWQGTYPARPRHVRDARHTAGQFLAGGARVDETLLICSELATNSVLHSRSKYDGKFILRVVVHADYIWIECEDAGGPWHIPDNDDRPHGLDVVHTLCGAAGWGVEDLDGGRTGRVVWARLELGRRAVGGG